MYILGNYVEGIVESVQFYDSGSYSGYNDTTRLWIQNIEINTLDPSSTVVSGTTVTVSLVGTPGAPGLAGGEGIQGPGYLATGLISNNLNLSTISIDGGSSQTVNFTGNKIAYQAGDRVKVAQVSNPSNYIGGLVNAVVYGTPIASGIAPNVTYSFPTSVNVVIDSKGGSDTWTANSTQLSISLAADPSTVLTIVAAKTSAYTIANGDQGDLIQLNGTFTVSIPTDATFNFAIGTQITLLNIGTGVITVAATTPGTTTVNATPGLKLRAQWSSATLIKRAANTWVVIGDLIA
jgi:hypothetical protein